MRRLLPFLVAFVATVPVFSQNAPAGAAKPAAAPAAAPVDAAKAIEDFRADLQAKRADIMAKNISLSADQAAKFWPMYEKYQAEQNVIIDAQELAFCDSSGLAAFVQIASRVGPEGGRLA